MSVYKKRCIEGLDEAGGFYCKHVLAMTEEGLHDKSDIAAELGYRDMQMKKLIPILKDIVVGQNPNAALRDLALAIISDTLRED